MPRIRVAVVGVGNCASALIQGTHYYSRPENSTEGTTSGIGTTNGMNGTGTQGTNGLLRPTIGPYQVTDIDFVVGFDIDVRKIGLPLNQAIFAKPNCCAMLDPDVKQDTSGRFSGIVLSGPQYDGVADHMVTSDINDSERFMTNYSCGPIVDSALNCINSSVVDGKYSLWPQKDSSVQNFARKLKDFEVTALVNYLPVGSQRATEFWANVCIEAKVPMVNCIPVFIASNLSWSSRFAEAGVAIIGDDMKSQFGASVLSQMFQELAEQRGHKVKVHIQQNSGGNTDFLNMTDQGRLASKKISKENVLRDHGTAPEFLHAGPSDYIRHYKDTKVAHFHLELEGFCGAPVKLDARLEVQDSPNSAGVVIDALRYVSVAQANGIYGALNGPSAFTQKSPPVHMPLSEAIKACDAIAALKL
jgi:myo-inositol-1-phosphate synthase